MSFTVDLYARVLTGLHDRLMTEQIPYSFRGRPIFWVRRARRAWIDVEVRRLAALGARVVDGHGLAAARLVPVPVRARPTGGRE